jgi:hypothetical protein
MRIQKDPPSEVAPRSSTRDSDVIVLESSLESFPASDPPAWVFGRDSSPASRRGVDTDEGAISLAARPNETTSASAQFPSAAL